MNHKKEEPKIVERVVYIKSEKDFEDAKVKAASVTQNVIEMLQQGMKASFIASSLGVTQQFVLSLANVTGFMPSRGKERLFQFHTSWSGAKQGLTFPFDYLDIVNDVEWKLAAHDKEKKTITIEYRDATGA